MSIDVTTINWAEDAARELKAHVYTTLKLPPDLGKRVQQLYGDAERAFDDRASRRQLRVPEDDRDDLDARNGFIDDRKREWLELHTSIPADFGGPVDAPPATRLLECACAVEHAFRALCQQVLEVLARSSPPLAALVAEEARSPLPPPGARESSRGFAESMLRVYRYDSSFRQREGEGHYDMGLLTLIPRSTSPGLQINELGDRGRAPWVAVEKEMGEGEAVLFGGMTLSRILQLSTPDASQRLGHAPVFLRLPALRSPPRGSSDGSSWRRDSADPPRAAASAERRPPATPADRHAADRHAADRHAADGLVHALLHRVCVDDARGRLSACYFHRPSPHCHIGSETVLNFNARARAAHDDELSSDGAVSLSPRDARDFERRLSRELWFARKRERGRSHSRSRDSRPRDSRHRDSASRGRSAYGARGDRRGSEGERAGEGWGERGGHDRSERHKLPRYEMGAYGSA